MRTVSHFIITVSVQNIPGLIVRWQQEQKNLYLNEARIHWTGIDMIMLQLMSHK